MRYALMILMIFCSSLYAGDEPDFTTRNAIISKNNYEKDLRAIKLKYLANLKTSLRSALVSRNFDEIFLIKDRINELEIELIEPTPREIIIIEPQRVVKQRVYIPPQVTTNSLFIRQPDGTYVIINMQPNSCDNKPEKRRDKHESRHTEPR